MADLTLSMPEDMKSWIEAQSATGRYADASDFIRDLVRREQDRLDARRHGLETLQEAWAEGLESGVSEATPADIRKQFLEKLDGPAGA